MPGTGYTKSPREASCFCQREISSQKKKNKNLVSSSNSSNSLARGPLAAFMTQFWLLAKKSKAPNRPFGDPCIAVCQREVSLKKKKNLVSSSNSSNSLTRGPLVAFMAQFWLLAKN